MPLQKNDFIEIEFTGKTKNGEIFDSNIKEDLEKIHKGHDHKIEVKPFVFSLGHGMFLRGAEDFLIGKEIGEYEISLTSESAFGKRNPSLIQVVPSKIFKDQKINPAAGYSFNFDGRVGKIIAVSGGRVTVDFNNPLAGKDIVYKIRVLRKVEGINEKVKSLNEFLFRKDFEFEVRDKKLTLKADKQFAQFVKIFEEKFKEILGLDLEVVEVEDKDEKALP
ncbi:MAG: peptidylprolyl isomerase [Nanoarchaeota archaeon]